MSKTKKEFHTENIIDGWIGKNLYEKLIENIRINKEYESILITLKEREINKEYLIDFVFLIDHLGAKQYYLKPMDNKLELYASY